MNQVKTSSFMNFSRTIFGGFVLLAAFGIFFNFGHIQSEAKSGFLDNVFSIVSFAFEDGDFCCDDETVDDAPFDDGDFCCEDDEYIDDEDPIEETEDDVPPVELPVCTLAAEPTTIWEGQWAKLYWTSKLADTGVIDNGVGALILSTSPNAAGQVSVHPSETTTYTATFTNEDGEVECKTTVIVKKKSYVPVCTLLPEEQYINKGESATLTWTSQYATTGVMDENVGNLTPVAGGSVQVSPTETTSYKAVFTGADGEIACHATVKVKSTPAPKYCKLEITKSADVTNAAPGTMVWYTINFKNIGTKDCTGGGVQIVDVVDSRLEYIAETHSSDVSAGYGGDAVYTASSRTLQWNAHTLTPGESGWVKWQAKVGTPTACTETIPNTAKITAYEYDNFTRWETSNTVNVAVARNCGNPVPACTLTLSKSQMAKGESAQLSWTGTNVTSVTIDNGIGATTTVNGGVTVQPQDNATYTGTFTGQYGTVTCQASITITTGGGGCTGFCGRSQQPPKVVLYQKAQLQPLASVYLSQVPYTGFDAGPITTAVYWTLLVLWSALVAYFLVYRGYWGKILPASGAPLATTKQSPRVANTIEEEFEADEDEAVVASTMTLPTYSAATFSLPTREMPVSAPVRAQTEKILIPANDVEKTVEKTLGADHILISKHGMELIAEAAQDGVDLLQLLSKLSYAARRNYPREDGWIALSDERITETLSAVLPSLASAAAAKVATKESIPTIAGMAAEHVAAKSAGTALTPVAEFVQSIVKGEKDIVFATLRDAAAKGGVDALMLQAVLELDRVYRARVEHAKGADAAVVTLTATMSTAELEDLVRTLSAAIDETYTSSLTAAKLALANALARTTKKS